MVLALLLSLSLAAAPVAHKPGKSEKLLAGKVCGADNKACTILAHDAGADALGQSLSVVEVRGQPPPPDTQCERVRWVLVTSKDKKIAATRDLLDLCNDGYGASGVGEDTVQVGPNQLSFREAGGSSWRWTLGKIWQLSPLQLKSESDDGFWSVAANTEHREWSWTDFSGSVSWFAPLCNAEGSPQESDKTTNWDSTLVPDVEALPKDFAATLWKTTHLGGCAALIDGSAGHGFTTFGRKGGEKDSAMRVVRSGDTLFVEISDDRWTGAGVNWLNDDHLEVWLGKLSGGWQDPCLEPNKLKDARQWAVRLADGAVFPAYGNPIEALGVELDSSAPEGTAKTYRLKLTLPRGFDLFTVVYSDSDEGKRQERLIATSRLEFGVVPSFGQARKLKAAEASCVVREGKLEPVPSSNVAKEGPLHSSGQ